MRMRLEFELDIDTAKWGDEYDVRGSTNVVQDVAHYVADLIENSYAMRRAGAIRGLDATVAVRMVDLGRRWRVDGHDEGTEA